MANDVWSIPPDLFEGQDVAIYASGPSLKQEHIDATRSMASIAINDCYRLAPHATMLFAADLRWWHHHADAHKFAGLRVTTSANVNVPDIKRLKINGFRGYETAPDTIRTGNNSGYQALHIAIRGGPRRIFMFGFDMSSKNGHHWFGKHPPGLMTTHEDCFQIWTGYFNDLAVAAERLGVEVVNCTPQSTIMSFPKVEFHESLLEYA